MASKADKPNAMRSFLDELPLDRLKDEMKDAAGAAGSRAISAASQRLDSATDRLNNAASGGRIVRKAASKGAEAAAGGTSPIAGALKGTATGLASKAKDALPSLTGGGGTSRGGRGTKATNIIESIDVGVPISVAYNQWTQYDEWSSFMKKVEAAEQDEDEATVNVEAQIFWSHRAWEATIEEQVPNEYIAWRSTGEKGHVDGTVTFHELGPRLTRILVVLEYYPKGLVEHVGNIWRAPGRRARLELKHFRRHVMVNTLLDPDAVEGWRGEVHDAEVTKTHDEVVEEEEPEEGEEVEEYEEEPEEYEGQTTGR